MKTKKRLLMVFAVVAAFMFLAGTSWAGETGKININTASVEELAQLKKIGPKCAQKIVVYREKNGPFKHPEDIMKVKGIGPKTFELNKDRIVVDQLDDTTVNH